jgi:hypothetical protein
MITVIHPNSSNDKSKGSVSSVPIESPEELYASDSGDESSESLDEIWTPSVNGKNSDDELDLDDTGSIWQEIPIRYRDFSIKFNKVGTDLEYGYIEEVKELRKRVSREYNTITSDSSKPQSMLNANQVMNSVYNAELLFSVLGFQNKSLIE